ncbi:MAG: hypothetical protein RR128_09800 [Clostridium sp.]
MNKTTIKKLLELVEGMPNCEWERLKTLINIGYSSQMTKTKFKRSDTFQKYIEMEFGIEESPANEDRA